MKVLSVGQKNFGNAANKEKNRFRVRCFYSAWNGEGKLFSVGTFLKLKGVTAWKDGVYKISLDLNLCASKKKQNTSIFSLNERC